jgi:hypothetical protein
MKRRARHGRNAHLIIPESGSNPEMDFRRSLQRGIGAQLDNHPEIVSSTKNNWKSYRRFSPDAD